MVKDGMVREPEQEQLERVETRLSGLFQQKTAQRKAARAKPAEPDAQSEPKQK